MGTEPGVGLFLVRATFRLRSRGKSDQSHLGTADIYKLILEDLADFISVREKNSNGAYMH
jgi:hypothetical protein